MPQILDNDAARFHLRVGDEVTDAQLAPLIAAAEAGVSDFLGRPLIDAGDGWPDIESLPANVVHAIKVVLTDLYEHRATPLEDMMAVRHLIGRYVVPSVG